MHRALILQAMFSLYIGAPTSVIKKWLDDNNLLTYLSPKEHNLLNKHERDISKQEMNDLSWNIESIYALLWVGSIYKDLPLQTHAPDNLVKYLPNIKNNDSIKKFIENFKMRSFEEIYIALDLYYRAHWYARDCHITSKDSKNFDLPTIEYRRRALGWLFDSEANWDDIRLDT